MTEGSINDLPFEIVNTILQHTLNHYGQFYGFNEGRLFNAPLLQHLKNLRTASRHVATFVDIQMVIELTGALFRPSHYRWLIRHNSQFASRDLAVEYASYYWNQYVHRQNMRISMTLEYWDMKLLEWIIDVDNEAKRNPLIIYDENFGPADKRSKLEEAQARISLRWKYGDYQRNNRTNYPSPFSTWSRFPSRRKFKSVVGTLKRDISYGSLFTTRMYISPFTTSSDVSVSYASDLSYSPMLISLSTGTCSGLENIDAVNDYLRNVLSCAAPDTVRFKISSRYGGKGITCGLIDIDYDGMCISDTVKTWCTKNEYAKNERAKTKRVSKKAPARKMPKPKKDYPKKSAKLKWNRGPAKNKMRVR